MARKPRTRKTPEQIEAERIARRATDLEAVSLQPDQAALQSFDDVEITRAGQQRDHATDDKKVSHDTARRVDAFEALKAGMVAGAYDAARRLERDILARRGLLGRPEHERVDAARGREDYAVQAGLRVDAVLDRVPPRDAWLLQELIAPAIDRGTWRDHVRYVTGEAHQHGQAACVRAACLNLRDAYTAIERRAAA